MSDSNTSAVELQLQNQQLAERIRQLKIDGADKDLISAEVQKLKEVKEALQKLVKAEAVAEKIEFPREAFWRLLTQRFFVAPSFEIYGGIAGLYDLGPPGTAIKANLLAMWRQHFVLYENMSEVDCSCVTPYDVLKTSGHVAKFADLMVKDTQNGNCYRADHLLEQHLDKLMLAKDLTAEKIKEYKTVQAEADTFTKEVMGEMMKKYNVTAPETGNTLSEPEIFNLMFQTHIGPAAEKLSNRGFLRPETAQGIFVNFKRLLEYNSQKLPFAASQIGQVFRNEIAPRAGLLRVREFTLAEIEHFVNPEDKSHSKFADVANLVVTLFPRKDQITTMKTTEMAIGEAVERGIIANQTLGYFLGRTHMFLLAVGIKPDRLRFRQHLADEMAHYACDCWDAEIQNSYGWNECVGLADRSAFDLSAHSAETKVALSAFVEFPDGPKMVDTSETVLNKKVIGQKYKKEAGILTGHLESLSANKAAELEEVLAKGPTKITIGTVEFEVTPEMVSFKKGQKRVTGQQIVPGVIEPSFGIGRILYSLLEHAYYCREQDKQRAVLGLPAAIAPVKVSILPLMINPQLTAPVSEIVNILNGNGLSYRLDDSGATIGKRYARTDEIGIPFGITIDYETLENKTITLRERDTTTQVRVPVTEVANVIQALVRSQVVWSDVQKKYPAVESKE